MCELGRKEKTQQNFLANIHIRAHNLRRTLGGCSLGGVRSDETLGTDVVVRSLYYVLGNVGRIVELRKMNQSTLLK